jgi:hypothetical protein
MREFRQSFDRGWTLVDSSRIIRMNRGGKFFSRLLPSVTHDPEENRSNPVSGMQIAQDLKTG